MRTRGASRMGAEDAHRLARLDEQRLVVAEPQERPHDRTQGVVRPGRPAGAAVDHERLRVLGDLRVEVVEEHPQRRLGLPRAGVQLRAAWRPDRR